MVIDTCWMVTRAAGLKIQIKKDKKTAWQASYWEDGKEKEVTGWTVRMPDGTEVPRVAREYTYLVGHDAPGGRKVDDVARSTRAVRHAGGAGQARVHPAERRDRGAEGASGAREPVRAAGGGRGRVEDGERGQTEHDGHRGGARGDRRRWTCSGG